jgi:hypothetical protein
MNNSRNLIKEGKITKGSKVIINTNAGISYRSGDCSGTYYLDSPKVAEVRNCSHNDKYGCAWILCVDESGREYSIDLTICPYSKIDPAKDLPVDVYQPSKVYTTGTDCDGYSSAATYSFNTMKEAQDFADQCNEASDGLVYHVVEDVDSQLTEGEIQFLQEVGECAEDCTGGQFALLSELYMISKFTKNQINGFLSQMKQKEILDTFEGSADVQILSHTNSKFEYIWQLMEDLNIDQALS